MSGLPSGSRIHVCRPAGRRSNSMFWTSRCVYGRSGSGRAIMLWPGVGMSLLRGALRDGEVAPQLRQLFAGGLLEERIRVTAGAQGGVQLRHHIGAVLAFEPQQEAGGGLVGIRVLRLREVDARAGDQRLKVAQA